MPYVLGVIILGLGGWGIALYNRLIHAQQMLREAWSDIDVQLKRRYDLIPAIVSTVKGYAAHEQTTLEQVASARGAALSSNDLQVRGEAETALTRALSGVFALAEAYPDLRAGKNFLALQQALTDVEEQIQYARRYYNGTVRDLNILLQAFPGNLIAGMLGYHPAPYFEITLATEREAPGVAL